MEEQVRFLGALHCSNNCRDVRREMMRKAGWTGDGTQNKDPNRVVQTKGTQLLDKHQKIKFTALISEYRQDVLKISRAGVPRTKKQRKISNDPNNVIEVIDDNDLDRLKFEIENPGLDHKRLQRETVPKERLCALIDLFVIIPFQITLTLR